MAAPVPHKGDVEHWTVEQVAAWLQQVELSECCDTFLRKGIDGHTFLQLSEEELFLWGRDVSIRSRKRILKLVSRIKTLQQHTTTIRTASESVAVTDLEYDAQSDTERNDAGRVYYEENEPQIVMGSYMFEPEYEVD
ncbi:Sterile alpha and TIR motif-containing protein 1 [Chionoecetes opilio]|uniref:Sterile alpha and TIR motif-containing protein 1 n=1 Tax=Chionoecetes opilio TaxID=41210 RepID=A0A8J5CSF4_CHIOP|nr:Sterile alpha and TIR motif-containing protein 1 [Chionoecetes opilio]